MSISLYFSFITSASFIVTSFPSTIVIISIFYLISGASAFSCYSLGSGVSGSKIGSYCLSVSIYKTLQLLDDAFESLLGDVSLFLPVSSLLRKNTPKFKTSFCLPSSRLS